MNTIEQFINNNRDEFDSEKMKGGWEKIESRIKQKKTKGNTRRFWWTAAASIAIYDIKIFRYIRKWWK